MNIAMEPSSMMRCVIGIAAMIAVFVLGLGGCAHAGNIQEFPEPWQVLDSGKPLNKFPRVEILQQGSGAAIEPGDLVQLHLRTRGTSDAIERERGEWWLWVGFRSPKETAFFGNTSAIASSLVGVQQGTLLRFLEPKDNWISAGQLRPNAFGSPEY
jgi:hypothetical protein